MQAFRNALCQTGLDVSCLERDATCYGSVSKNIRRWPFSRFKPSCCCRSRFE